MVGGYTPEKVALRRAISLAYDIDARDPHASGAARRSRRSRRWRPAPAATTRRCRSENSDYDPARAKALLDLYGYVDRDGDGWREQPDGSPLVLDYVDRSRTQISRQFDELWKKNMDAVGIRIGLRDRASGPST